MINKEQAIKGVWVALVTPWDEARGGARLNTLTQLVQRFISAGVNGLFVLGTTGEWFLYTVEERKYFAEVVLEKTEGKLPIAVHVGHDSTKIAIELAMHARKIGAQLISVSSPGHYCLDSQELENHFVAVAEAAADIPVLLYDAPFAGNNIMDAHFLERLYEKTPNVIGAKVSHSDWSVWKDYLKLAGSFTLLVGNDLLCLPCLLMGAAGIVSGPANVFPELYVGLFRKVTAQDIKSAVQYQSLINELCRTLNYGQPLAYIKTALQKLGWDVGDVRPPLRHLNEEEEQHLDIRLKKVLAKMEKLESNPKEVVEQGTKLNWLAIFKCKIQTKGGDTV